MEHEGKKLTGQPCLVDLPVARVTDMAVSVFPLELFSKTLLQETKYIKKKQTNKTQTLSCILSDGNNPSCNGV